MPYLGSHFIRRAVFALALTAVVSVCGIWGPDARGTEAGSGSMAAMSIDTNVGGNTATAIGVNDACISANAGDTVTLDVTARDIPATNPMLGFAYTLGYDSDVFVVTTSDVDYMVAALPGSNILAVGEPMPDIDGVYMASALDLADPEPQDPNVNSTSESGSGVLERLTIEINSSAAAGSYSLTLASAAHIDILNGSPAPDALNNATIAVDQACPSVFGDVDCGGGVSSVDSLKVLRFNAALSVSQTEPCADIGGVLPNAELQGDVDCTDDVNSVDALKVLRHSSALSVTQNEGCPEIGM